MTTEARSPLLFDWPDRLESDRLLLPILRPGDGALLNSIVQESLAELQPWMPWATPAPTVEQSEEFVRRAHVHFHERKGLHVLLVLKETGEPAGVAGLHSFRWEIPSGEIGYWARSRAAGRGLIRETVQALTRFGIGQLGLVRVEIRCDARNQRSAWVATAAGYEREGCLRREMRAPDGTLRDTLVFSRLASPADVAADARSLEGRRSPHGE